MNVIEVDIGDFSPTPYGRYKKDGPKSGELFRSKYLVPALKDPGVDKVVVKLDSVSPGYEYSSSFLEEVFGGLVRVDRISISVLNEKLRVVTVHADYVIEIESYIKRAAS